MKILKWEENTLGKSEHEQAIQRGKTFRDNNHEIKQPNQELKILLVRMLEKTYVYILEEV